MFDWFWRPFAPPAQTGNVAILNTPTPQPRTATGAPYINYQPTQPTPTTPPVQQVQTVQPTAQATELQSRYGTRYVGYENLVVRKPTGGFDTRAADAAIAQTQRQRETTALRASQAPVDVFRYGAGRTTQEERVRIVQQIQAAPRDQREPLLARYRTLEAQQWRQGMEAEAQIEGRPSIALQTLRAKEPAEVLQIRAEPKAFTMPTMAPRTLQPKESFQPKTDPLSGLAPRGPGGEPAKSAPIGFFDALDRVNESLYGAIASKVPGGKETIETTVSKAATKAVYGPHFGQLLELVPEEARPIPIQIPVEVAKGIALDPIQKPATAALMFGAGAVLGGGTRVTEAVLGSKRVSTILSASPRAARAVSVGGKLFKEGLITAAGVGSVIEITKPVPVGTRTTTLSKQLEPESFEERIPGGTRTTIITGEMTTTKTEPVIRFPTPSEMARRTGGVISQLGVGMIGFKAGYKAPEIHEWLIRDVPEVPLWRAGSAQELKPGVKILDVRPELDLTKVEAKPIAFRDAAPRVNIEEIKAVSEAQDVRLLVNIARRSGFSKVIGGQYYTGAERAGISSGMEMFPDVSFSKPAISDVVIPKTISIATPAQRAVSIAGLSYPIIKQTPFIESIVKTRVTTKQSDYLAVLVGTNAITGVIESLAPKVASSIITESLSKTERKERSVVLPRIDFLSGFDSTSITKQIQRSESFDRTTSDGFIQKYTERIGGPAGFLAGAGLGGGGGGGGPQPRSAYSWVVRNPVPRLRDILGGGKKKRGRRRRHRR